MQGHRVLRGTAPNPSSVVFAGRASLDINLIDSTCIQDFDTMKQVDY